MQLLLETETSDIGIKDKMSTLEQESSLSEELIANGNIIEAPSRDVPNGNKENIIAKDNIIENFKERVGLNHDNQILSEEILTQCTATVDASAVAIEKEPEVRENATNENSISNFDNSTSENMEKNSVTISDDGKQNEESYSDIVPETEVDQADQQLVSIKTENVEINQAEKIEIGEGKINDVDVKRENDKCLEGEETQLLANDKEKNLLQVGIKKEVELEKIIKLEQDNNLKEVYNSNHVVILENHEKAAENALQEVNETFTEKSSNSEIESDLREQISESDPNAVNTERPEVNQNLEKNCFPSKTVLNCSDQTEIPTIGNNQDIGRDSHSVDKAPSEIPDTPSDCDDQTKTPAIETNQETQSNNDAVDNVLSEITRTSLDCGVQMEIPAVESNQNIQSTNGSFDDMPNEITSTSLDYGVQIETPAIQSYQDSQSNKNAVDKVSIVSNDVSQSPMECDETDMVTSNNNDNTEIFMDCDKVAKSDVDIIAESPVECHEITNATAKMEGTVTTVDCDYKTNVSETDVVMDVVGNVADSDKDKVSKKPDYSVDSSETNHVLPNVNNCGFTEKDTCENKNNVLKTPTTDSINEILDVDEMKLTSDKEEKPVTEKLEQLTQQKKKTPTICRLSNTLNILSDDEDDPIVEKQCENNLTVSTDKQCINIEDDDDIMLIDEDIPSKVDETVTAPTAADINKEDESKSENSTNKSIDFNENEKFKESTTIDEKESPVPETGFAEPIATPEIDEKLPENIVDKLDKPISLVPENLFKSYKKNLADMTRDDLEEFCILKIVESIIDRSNLTEIRSKIKAMAQNIEEHKKKATALTKQNRDLQLVLKSVQEEQKKASDSPITPLKITRSVGMQVLMTDRNARRKGIASGINTTGNTNVNNRPPPRNAVIPNARLQPQQPQQNNSQQIPVPRLVPAASTNSTIVNKSNTGPQVNSPKNTGKNASPLPNGVRPAQKSAEKRSHNKMLTVDLTDDEPPSKVPAKITSAPPVRLVPPQNLLAPRQPLSQSQPVNSPRKVYIPISGPQGQNVRPGQTIMLKSVPPPGPRQRGPVAPIVRLPQNSVRMARVQGSRHPAPLPESTKQYQPPNWKALPPAPDLKLSKVENGIVISWKIEGYQEDSYEEIASYQLYAYQETSSPPNTSLWKKIGDVKALPLPMACTLTQFMAGYKYYFAVRAVDVKSRLGPFSLPGSILLLNKM